MTLRLPARLALPLAPALACALHLPAQQLIGYVPTRDATITGSTDELDGRAVLMGAASVTAKDHTAPITLGRGGTVRVCQTSVLRITESKTVSVAAPLLFSLDRGAVEIDTKATPSDTIMTPDLRFTVRTAGPLDLRLRVARNGDTCVENRGPGGPTLAVSDPFGESMYELPSGQHVLFEHGSLHDVVDHESSACGCPDEKGMSMAEALIAPGSTATSSGVKSTAPPAHPFPAAISEGLVPSETPPATPPVGPPPNPQIGDSLSYNAAMADPDALSPDKPAKAAPPTVAATAAPTAAPAVSSVTASAAVPAPSPAPPPPEPKATQPAAPSPTPPSDLIHVVGRMFRKLFGGH